jgi:hypothetical protein
MFRKIWKDTLEFLDSYSEISIFGRFLDNVKTLIASIVDDFVRLARDILLDIGTDLFKKTLPEISRWIFDEFDGICEYKDLSKTGLESVVDISLKFRSESSHAMDKIFRSPRYRISPNTVTVSWDALVYSVNIIASTKNRSGYDFLIKHIQDNIKLESRSVGIYIDALWRYSKEIEPDRQYNALKFLMGLVERKNLSLKITAKCINAVGRLDTPQSGPWLIHYLTKSLPEETKRAIILALLKVSGERAMPEVIRFLQTASIESCITIASAAWRVDSDLLYDALINSHASKDKRLRVNLIYSWFRARNPRLTQAIIQGLGASDSKLKTMAAISAGDCLEYCGPSREQREAIVTQLKAILRDSTGVLKLGTVLSLIQAGEHEYKSHVTKQLNELLFQQDIVKICRVLQVVGVRMTDWPDFKLCRVLLFHPSSEIRHTMCYVLGYQKRDFLEELRLLQKDISSIYPSFRDDQTAEITGSTVSEAAILATRRIKGESQPLRLPNI